MPVDETKLELALADLRQQIKPNFKGTTTLYNINWTILCQCFLGHQQSILDSRSETSRHLSNDMEKILIDFINCLTEHSLPPTSQIVKNIAEELCNMLVGKNWVGQFTHRPGFLSISRMDMDCMDI
jgi:hypothetical protein